MARRLLRLAALALLSALAAAPPIAAQQSVRVKSDGIDIPAQLYRPATPKAPAVALFHGCGGVGQNNTRMAGLLQSWGYVALVVDSFSSRGLKDVCGRNWPTQGDAEKRALDDWTPVAQCQALFDRIATGRDLLETHVYPGAHHSFDALGLPVRYLDGVGNRSKPGGCCGAHYGANEAAWKAFVGDVRAFVQKGLPL